MNGTQIPNTYHSVFMWKDDGKVYLVATDNEEFHDVDIYDISNPRAPKPVAEYDLLESSPQIAQTDDHPRLAEIFQHDMVTKVIDGRDVLLNSYWDAGYVMLDVENPAKAFYIGDSDFENEDPLVPGISPPEGNAHEAEFSHDSKYFLGADEDFNPYRSDKFFVDSIERPAVEVGGGTSPASLRIRRSAARSSTAATAVRRIRPCCYRRATTPPRSSVFSRGREDPPHAAWAER